NGPDGGPLHPHSEPFHLMFQAGVSLASIALAAEDGTAVIVIRYATALDFQYTLESSPHLGDGAVWTPVGESEAGDNHLHTLTVPASDGARYFRLRRDPL
ncbi:MAG: hypothetical protein J0L84_08060, partial [Verrucomicrobia bacterium]|nr:hypothetical protein [Verrucomicrobiota bacterium]